MSKENTTDKTMTEKVQTLDADDAAEHTDLSDNRVTPKSQLSKMISSPSVKKKRLFVITVGGTGARVMKSLLMLMAAGEFRDKEIVPVVVDFDISSGDRKEVIRLIQEYKSIHSSYSDSQAVKADGFFAASVSSLSAADSQDWTTVSQSQCSGKNSLAELTGYDLLLTGNEPVKYLMDSIFGEKDDIVEPFGSYLSSDFETASIAHIYNNNRLSDCLQELKSVLNPTDDEVVIVGSTFGCSGTSGICYLLAGIKQMVNVRTAVIMVEPFVRAAPFCVSTKINSIQFDDVFEDKSNTFISFFYATKYHSLADTVYHVKAQDKTVIHYNDYGGEKQRIKSCVAEFLSALAILHFVNHPNNTGVVQFNKSDFNESCYTVDDFKDGQYGSTMHNLSAFAVSSFWMKKNMCDTILGHSPLKKMYSEIEHNRSGYLRELNDFMQCFEEWSEDMRNDARDANRVDFFDFKCQTLNELISNHFFARPTGLRAIFHRNENMSEYFYECMQQTFFDEKYDKQTPSAYEMLHLLSVAGSKVACKLLNR